MTSRMFDTAGVCFGFGFLFLFFFLQMHWDSPVLSCAGKEIKKLSLFAQFSILTKLGEVQQFECSKVYCGHELSKEYTWL